MYLRQRLQSVICGCLLGVRFLVLTLGTTIEYRRSTVVTA